MEEIKLRTTREPLVDIVWKSNPKKVGKTIVDLGQKFQFIGKELVTL